MQRLTISLDDDIAQNFDEWIEKKGYDNRSEAIRDLLRQALAREHMQNDNGRCVAVVSYSYPHHARTVSTKLMDHNHDHHELVVSSMHVHMSHDRCVETSVLRGPFDQVQALAQSMIAMRGIEEGAVHYITDEPSVSQVCEEDYHHTHKSEIMVHDHEH